MNGEIALELEAIRDIGVALHALDRLGRAGADRAFLAQCAATVVEPRREPPWCAYLATPRDADAKPVGLCCFKTAPSSGEVEIAYAVAPGARGRGLARAMVAALGELAATNGATMLVAHTLRRRNASTTVLERSGFRRAGSHLDPEDGWVWRWEREPILPGMGAGTSAAGLGDLP